MHKSISNLFTRILLTLIKSQVTYVAEMGKKQTAGFSLPALICNTILFPIVPIKPLTLRKLLIMIKALNFQVWLN